MRSALIGVFAVLCCVPVASAKGSHSSGHSGHSGHHGGHSSGHHRGKIKRSHAATHAFQSTHPCPSTQKKEGKCPGYVIDHIDPLKRGGADSPDNMQWQTKAQAKAKDRVE